VEHGFIEPEAGLAVPDATGRITVYCGGQIPFNDRAMIAASLNVPEERARVINCLIGGVRRKKTSPSDSRCCSRRRQGARLHGFQPEESLLVHPSAMR
jgi:CO/xanthine dehydrogenase Mo-binding subunit